MATLACEYRCNEKAVVVMTLLPRPFRVSLRTAKCCNEIVYITLIAAYSELCCKKTTAAKYTMALLRLENELIELL